MNPIETALHWSVTVMLVVWAIAFVSALATVVRRRLGERRDADTGVHLGPPLTTNAGPTG